jgi:hypothetical protein
MYISHLITAGNNADTRIDNLRVNSICGAMELYRSPDEPPHDHVILFKQELVGDVI